MFSLSVSVLSYQRKAEIGDSCGTTRHLPFSSLLSLPQVICISFCTDLLVYVAAQTAFLGITGCMVSLEAYR